jgi:hypothetical protein
MPKYYVFVRDWWKENPSWPNGLEPEPNARRTVIAESVDTEEEARAICREYNRVNPPGRLSRKAEYDTTPAKRRR